ncbi:exodeoxyribonuclease VII small subunit [Aestuariivirga litoralis]|uniref:exodeoxyribonuclease VII small subunit n=1 Tax=Aestuariivirga litoralis TaxID=2650924 RepID=UPI0018C7D152|nr:exodeoxyribonuclease VII small subunit [Aestuariivirga litoralis]MBG1233082.1 exodeoxyribonuclease VII small subunit [Aestuariivirga litoralis]
MSDATDITGMTFEKALAELETIVAKLESGKVDLEESIKIYERGEALRKHCQTKLAEAEARIEKITLSPQGKPTGVTKLDVE